MSTSTRCLVVVMTFALSALASAAAARGPESTARRTRAAGATSVHVAPSPGLVFEPNLGQAAEAVRYVVRQPGGTVFLTDSEIVVALREDSPPRQPGDLGFRCSDEARATIGVLRISIEGARARRVAPGPALGSVSNYFIGADPRGWITHVPHETSATWIEALPGIDVRFHGDRGPLEFDLHVAPRALSRRLALRVEGAESAALDALGNLVLRVGSRELVLGRPVAWQEDGPMRLPVTCTYALAQDGRVELRLDSLRAGLPLVVDPTLAFATYLGGTLDEWATGLAVDASGAVFVSGATRSLDFPVASGLQPGHSGGGVDGFDGYVTKLTPGGSIAWSTYLGGSDSDDYLNRLALDPLGRPHVTGWTRSLDFPMVAALQPSHAGGVNDMVIVGLSAAGDALTFSTYLGGDEDEIGTDVSVDAAGAIYVIGEAHGGSLPVSGAPPLGVLGPLDMLVAKLAPNGSALVYCTLAGGSGNDYAWGIAVNAAGEALVVGPSDSIDFPQINPLQPGYGGGPFDAAVLRLDAAGTTWLQSTNLGGAGMDMLLGVAFDALGNAAIAGLSESPDFPLLAPLQATLAGASDMTLTVLDPAGTMMRSTFIGGTSDDTCFDLALDPSGAAVLVGTTLGPGALEIDGLGLGAFGGSHDAIVAEVDAAGTAVTFATSFGGTGSDEGRGIALTPSGDIVVLGMTSSTDMPVANAAQPANGGGREAFVARISRCGGGARIDLDQDGEDDRCVDWRNHGQYVSSVTHACRELGPPPGYATCAEVVRAAARSDVGKPAGR